MQNTDTKPGDLPRYNPMRTAGPDLRTKGSWRAEGRRVVRGANPDAWGWRHPGRYYGHYYGGWMPLYSREHTQ
jgi:hypothetical protein